MKDINPLMDTVDAKWELAYTEWQTQIVFTDQIESIDEIFRKQLSALREMNNALELKIKETAQKLAEEMAMIKANEIFNSLLDGQESSEYKNEQIEPTIATDEISVNETKPICDAVKTNHSGDVLLQSQQQQSVDEKSRSNPRYSRNWVADLFSNQDSGEFSIHRLLHPTSWKSPHPSSPLISDWLLHFSIPSTNLRPIQISRPPCTLCFPILCSILYLVQPVGHLLIVLSYATHWQVPKFLL
jgi:hypothetical protein